MSSSLIRDVGFVRKIGESVNATLNDEACKLVAFEVEYTLRLIIQVSLLSQSPNELECDKIFKTFQS